MTRLNEVRDDHTIYNNRLDTTLADVFNLLSLFYLTIGKTRECPATYSQIASMRVSLMRLFRLTRHRVARFRPGVQLRLWAPGTQEKRYLSYRYHLPSRCRTSIGLLFMRNCASANGEGHAV